MKLLVFICLFVYCGAQKVAISNRLDALDIEYVLSTGRILDNYIKCILDRGPCTAEGRELRAAIPEALIYGCKHCSEPTKKLMRKASLFMMKNRPDVWETLRKHFDPDGKYRPTFYKFLGTSYVKNQ